MFLDDEGVAKYKLPERLELVAEMPLSPAGKVLKTALEKDIEEKIKAGV
jgi:2,3-dihydroxybenzoate-AMP ligase